MTPNASSLRPAAPLPAGASTAPDLPVPPPGTPPLLLVKWADELWVPARPASAMPSWAEYLTHPGVSLPDRQRLIGACAVAPAARAMPPRAVQALEITAGVWPDQPVLDALIARLATLDDALTVRVANNIVEALMPTHAQFGRLLQMVCKGITEPGRQQLVCLTMMREMFARWPFSGAGLLFWAKQIHERLTTRSTPHDLAGLNDAVLIAFHQFADGKFLADTVTLWQFASQLPRLDVFLNICCRRYCVGDLTKRMAELVSAFTPDDQERLARKLSRMFLAERALYSGAVAAGARPGPDRGPVPANRLLLANLCDFAIHWVVPQFVAGNPVPLMLLRDAVCHADPDALMPLLLDAAVLLDHDRLVTMFEGAMLATSNFATGFARMTTGATYECNHIVRLVSAWCAVLRARTGMAERVDHYSILLDDGEPAAKSTWVGLLRQTALIAWLPASAAERAACEQLWADAGKDGKAGKPAGRRGGSARERGIDAFHAPLATLIRLARITQFTPMFWRIPGLSAYPSSLPSLGLKDAAALVNEALLQAPLIDARGLVDLIDLLQRTCPPEEFSGPAGSFRTLVDDLLGVGCDGRPPAWLSLEGARELFTGLKDRTGMVLPEGERDWLKTRFEEALPPEAGAAFTKWLGSPPDCHAITNTAPRGRKLLWRVATK